MTLDSVCCKVLSSRDWHQRVLTSLLELKYFIHRICGSPARWYWSWELQHCLWIRSSVLQGYAAAAYRITLLMTQLVTGATCWGAPMKEPYCRDWERRRYLCRSAAQASALSAATVADYVGGDTASFRPLKLDEEEVDEDVLKTNKTSITKLPARSSFISHNVPTDCICRLFFKQYVSSKTLKRKLWSTTLPAPSTYPQCRALTLPALTWRNREKPASSLVKVI